MGVNSGTINGKLFLCGVLAEKSTSGRAKSKLLLVQDVVRGLDISCTIDLRPGVGWVIVDKEILEDVRSFVGGLESLYIMQYYF